MLVPSSDLRTPPGAAHSRTAVGGNFLPLVFASLLALFAAPSARADVGVVLNESLDTSVARITGSGHSAVYFSRICPASPVKLRLCQAGENGSVMSNYTTLGEDQPFEWNIVPLNVYLYGVENPRHRPIAGSQKIKRVLEERYREKYLSDYCATESCQTSNKAEWREMVGATLSRSMYIFVVGTTVEQDLALIGLFNSLPNENHFNGMTRNCADFTRRVINTYFRNATGPDYINDFGMTSPKAIARSFTRYAHRHPEANFRVLHFAQVPGTIKRSSECRGGTEQLVRSKKLLVPMIIFADHVLPFVAASYLLTGRFNAQHELEQHPTLEATQADYQIKLAKAENDDARVGRLAADKDRQKAKVVGTAREWKRYRTSFAKIVAAASAESAPAADASLTMDGSMKKFFRKLDEAGTPVADGNGALWLEFSDGDSSPASSPSKIGLSASNLFSSGTDTELAYQLVLARVDHVLKSPKHSRESMVEFKKDWNLLESAHYTRASALAKASPAGSPGSNVLSGSE